MADGLNEARAMRIAEILNDYQAIQHQIANHPALAAGQETLPAGVIVRNATQQAQVLLSRPLPAFNNPPSPGEDTRASLQRITLDAAARRFLAWRAYQRILVGQRALDRRNQLLQGRAPTAAQQPLLAQIDNALRQEVLAVTDAKIFQELNAKDVAAANWTAEMPPLARIQQYIQQNLA